MPKISVIIPVYNVEKYLPRCLDSVISQTYDDIEIICINDGSTDNSLNVLNEYAQKDNRIIVIDKQNEGVSAARNDGLNRATGEVIMFLDSDDAYVPEACQLVAERFEQENPDIVCFGHITLENGEVVSDSMYLISKLARRGERAKLRSWISLQLFIWEKAFKKRFLDENNIRFPAGINNAEDMVFCCLSYFSNPKYSFILKQLYLYTQKRENSATTQSCTCIKNDVLAYKYLISSDSFKRQSKELKLCLTNHFMGGSVNYWKNLKNEDYRLQYFNDIQDYINVVSSNFCKRDCLKMKHFKQLKRIVFLYRVKQFFKLDILVRNF